MGLYLKATYEGFPFTNALCGEKKESILFIHNFSIYSSASKYESFPSECPCTEDHISTHFDSSTIMTDKAAQKDLTDNAAQKDLDLIELALRRLLSDDKSHDLHGEDVQSKLIRDEKDRDLLFRLLDQVNSLKAERGQNECENSLPRDDGNSDTELHGRDKIGGQVRNEEVREEIRKVKKQNKLTHLILGIILASNVIWGFSELSVALLIRKKVNNPFRLIGSLMTGNFRRPVTENHSSHNHKGHLLPHVEAPAIPHFEVPSLFQTEDKALHISNGTLANGSDGQAQENISVFDLLLKNPSSNEDNEGNDSE